MSPERKPGFDSEDATVAEAASPAASAPDASPVQNGDEPVPQAPEAGADLDSVPGAAEEPEPEPVDVEALTAKAEQAERYLELAQRTKADFENFRKRAARDAAAAQQRGIAKLAGELLAGLDSLERALAHADTASTEDAESDGNGSFVVGIKHVHKDLLGALQRVGIQQFSPEGERFDPQLHEAVAQQPVEGAEPGTVVEVYQRGYRIGDSVLRPARVLVAG